MNHTPYEQLYSHLNNEIKMSHPHIIINLGVLTFIAMEKCTKYKKRIMRIKRRIIEQIYWQDKAKFKNHDYRIRKMLSMPPDYCINFRAFFSFKDKVNVRQRLLVSLYICFIPIKLVLHMNNTQFNLKIYELIQHLNI